MAFVDELFPQELAFGANGGPRFLTTIATGLSGAEARSGLWTRDLARYEFGMVNRNETETKALLAFFYCVAKGRANGFRFRDYNPGESRGTDEPIGVGDDTTRTFQLRKRYTIDSVSYDRVITKPVAGSVTVKVDGTPVAPASVMINTSTGAVVLLTVPAAGEIITASFQFDVPVRFGADWCAVRRIDRFIYSWEDVTLHEIRALSVLDMQAGADPENPYIEHWEYTETAAALHVEEVTHDWSE